MDEKNLFEKYICGKNNDTRTGISRIYKLFLDKQTISIWRFTKLISDMSPNFHFTITNFDKDDLCEGCHAEGSISKKMMFRTPDLQDTDDKHVPILLCDACAKVVVESFGYHHVDVDQDAE